MKELERKVTAYHEGGHALVWRRPCATLDPVTKMTILLCGRARTSHGHALGRQVLDHPTSCWTRWPT
ncbi:hypothetical protein QJS66_10045 [Kocuria rhizophila]|nr:hypothetical protein QJS66_10045 [Kocuria rhizophila]